MTALSLRLRFPIVFLLWGCLGLWPGPVRAEEPIAVSARAEPETITVGDRLLFSLRLEYPASVTLDLPSVSTTLGPFEVLERAAPAINELPLNRRSALLRFTLTAWSTGAYEIPPLEVPYEDAEGKRASLTTPPISVLVTSVIRDPAELTDIKDLKPQATLPGTFPMPPRELLALAAAVVAAGAAAVLLLRHRQRAPTLGPAPPSEASLTPEEVALQELDYIASLELLAQRAYRPFYTHLSACLRRYLHDRYALRAFDRTTTELRREMRVRGVDRWQALMIEELLRECDAVRFGRYQPALERAETALATAYEVIRAGRAATELVATVGTP